MGGIFSTTSVVTETRQEKWIGSYSNSQKILLAGEGDFSFAASLASFFGSANNIVATSLETRGKKNFRELFGKYPRAASNLITLELSGCTVVHGVDVHSMDHHSLLCSRSFDRIIFNFPHAAFAFKENTNYQIRLHQDVVRAFFRRASNMLTANGEVYVTHKTDHPFNRWNVVGLAEEVGLRLVRQKPFHKWDFPGYKNKRGSGWNCDGTFRVEQASTYMFKKLG